MDTELDAAAAAAAADQLVKSLDEWTSPKLGSFLNSTTVQYQRDPEDWLNEDEDSDDSMVDTYAAVTPKRTLQRADTPVMSNSSRKERTSSGQQPHLLLSSLRQRVPAIIRRSNPAPKSTHPEYRRYFDILVHFLRQKRRVLENIDLQQQEDALVVAPADGETNPIGDGYRHVISDEQKVDLEFLRSLNMVAWDRSFSATGMNSTIATKEGNFWLLLHALRKLGLPCLIWDDSFDARSRNKTLINEFLDNLAKDVMCTPAALIRKLHNSPDTPLTVKRRRSIQQWLEQCFDNVLPNDVKRPRKGQPDLSNKKLLKQGLYSTDKDKELFRASLSLILAGRLEDAQTLVRESGVSWRAAVWGGGSPHGYERSEDGESFTSYGNSGRALWRRMIWKLSVELKQDSAASSDEGAIAALLSSNLKAALDNSSLRQWEKGLYSTIKCSADRIEDKLLHIHNNNRRSQLTPFPGTQFREKELEHMFETSDMEGMDEREAVDILRSTPFEDMKIHDSVTAATASFLIGQNSIHDFMNQSLNEIEMDLDEKIATNELRFITHLALYLDSLSLGTTAVVLQDVPTWKNEVLLHYVYHLASREDLWYMIVLYASLLPPETIMDELPGILEAIESREERKIIVDQLEEFISTDDDLYVDILRAVIQSALSRTDDDEMFASGDDNVVPTNLDRHKMYSVLWFCFKDKHAGDAIIAANALMRQFFLAHNKTASAYIFVKDVLPEDISDKAQGSLLSDDTDEEGMAGYVHGAQIEHALSEHASFLSFLEASETVEEWEMKTKEASPIVDAASIIDANLDKMKLSDHEASIAASMEERRLIEEKRSRASTVIEAAQTALTALVKILKHPGGWLLTKDEVIAGGEEEVLRREELEDIRRKILPDVVFDYYDVCIKTANWMSDMLNDAVEKIGNNSNIANMLKRVDDMSEIMQDNKSTEEQLAETSMMSPVYWIEKALEAASMTQNDTYSTYTAFSTADLKNFSLKMDEAAALGAQYRFDICHRHHQGFLDL